jgi:hypothetical protein
MTLNTDKYLLKRFDRERYNCWDFVREVWAELTGADPFTTIPPSVDNITPKFTEIDTPQSPCLVLMLRQRCTPHVGVYYNGRVLHMNQRGAEYTALDSATACFPTVRYYK